MNRFCSILLSLALLQHIMIISCDETSASTTESVTTTVPLTTEAISTDAQTTEPFLATVSPVLYFNTDVIYSSLYEHSIGIGQQSNIEEKMLQHIEDKMKKFECHK